MFKMLTREERKIVEDNFINEKNCLTFFGDLCQLQEEKYQPQDVDLRNYSSDGITTGIITRVNYKEELNVMTMDVICDGSHRYLDLDADYIYELLRIRDDLISKGDSRDNENFEFLIPKPFLIEVENNLIVKLTPLNPELYNSCYSIFEKLMTED